MTNPTDTPRTDEQGRALGLAWFGLRDPLGRAQDESAKYRELARTLERELAAAKLSISEAQSKAESLQAKVDALMLEYCPEEMTPEQVAEWTRHQRAVEEPL